MQERIQAMRQWLGKTVHVEVDRPIGYCQGDILYSVNYGYIPGTLAGDGEAQDAYILGISHPIDAFDGQVIGVIVRNDDVEDKLVVAPQGMLLHQGQIAQAVHFQEQYFDTRVLSLFHFSCGVLPWREMAGKREYLLVFEQFSQCWSLPKGHMEAGETPAQTALRELWEETGLTAQLDTAHSATIAYDLRPIGHKQVTFFPGQVSGTPKAREGEIESFRWITEADLPNFLFPDTAEACKKLIAAIP